MNSGTRIVVWALVCLVAFVLSFAAGYHYASWRPVIVERDTVEVVRIDTLAVDRPVPVYLRTVDTLRVAVHDTTRVRDTLYMTLPREQAEYRDTLYHAWVSGFRPQLDSIRVFAPVRMVTVTERVPVEVARRWGLGVAAGYGLTLSPQPQFSPYVGVGISYNFVTW